jgi:oligopeptide/dipeptide ABC transporter ATP-binding protein
MIAPHSQIQVGQRVHEDQGRIAPNKPILSIRGLTAEFPGPRGPVTIVDDISLDVASGETLAVVGESGSGKTMTFHSALGLVPQPGRVVAGEALLEGVDLLKLPPEELRRRRGAEISIVFQDPLTALNPVFTIGDQIIEVIRAHMAITRSAARKQAVEVLARVQIPDPHRRIDDYPHQFSGGMRQRALIAMAIALGPKVLIADEPTTALDVTVQAQVLELLRDLKRETGMGLVLITHDLGVVARHADRVAVLYAGRVMEQGSADRIFEHPRQPYTVSLFRSIPHLDTPAGIELSPIEGQPPNPALLPPGCPFEPRCFLGQGRDDCRRSIPPLETTDDAGHVSRCWHWRALPETARGP